MNPGTSLQERRASRPQASRTLTALTVVAVFATLALWPGFTPLYDEAAAPGQRLTPPFAV
jgi:hypothetical protein